MSASDALRFLEHEASHEALCLLVPAMLKVLELEPMNGYEAEEFRRELKTNLADARAARV